MKLAQIQYGDLPNWLLVIITLFAVISAAYILKIERSRDQEARNQQRMSQASLVCAWPETVTLHPENPNAPYYYVTASCLNNSKQPIYKVQLIWFFDGKPVSPTHIRGVIPPERKEDIDFEKKTCKSFINWISPSNSLCMPMRNMLLRNWE